MAKHYQEWTLEFRNSKPENDDFRGIVLHIYGGTVEERIAEARAWMHLGPEWRVVSAQRDEAK